MIPISQLEDMFADMRSNPALNADGVLLWGYFFTDRDEEKLNQAAYALEDLGYRFVEIYPCDGEDSYWLHVERMEAHTPVTLFDRNVLLEAFAQKFGLLTYDGMDVGPVPAT
ncbi:MAG: ribonuclease E inhibitor RraB [Betaproteobacteria bacterium]